MDSQLVTKKVQVVCGESTVVGTLTIHHFSSREKRLRTLKVGAICFGVLVAFACIPGAHIILVPIWVLVAPFVILNTSRVPSRISAMNVSCAKCGGELSNTNSKDRYPIFETCKACHRENRLVQASQS